MAPKNKKQLKLRYLLIALLVFFFVFYIYAAKFYVPSLIKEQIEGFEEKRGVVIDPGNIYLDLYSGIVIKDLSLGEGRGEDPVKIKRLSVRPGYLQSVLQGKVVIDSVRLKKPKITADDRFFELIRKITSTDTGDDTGPSEIPEINSMEIDELTLTAGGVNISMKELDIDLSGINDSPGKLRLSGDLSGPVPDGRTGFASELVLLKEKKLALGINFPMLKSGDYSPHFRLPEDISISVSSEINYSSGLLTTGDIKISAPGSKDYGTINWDAGIQGEGPLKINTVRGGIKELIDMDLKGSVGKLQSDRVIETTGTIDIPDISVLSDWFPVLKKFDLKGRFTADELNISKSGDTTGINTGFSASSLETDFGEGDKLWISELTSVQNLDFYIKKNKGPDGYTVSADGLRAKGFSYINFEAEQSNIKDLRFGFRSGKWELGLKATGPEMRNDSIDSELSDFDLILEVNNKEGIDVNGRVKGASGRYSTFLLRDTYSSFNFKPGVLTFEALDTLVESYGRLIADKGVLVFPGETTPEYVIEIYSGSYRYFDRPVTADKLKALFVIKQDPEQNSMIEGKVVSEHGSVYGKKFQNLKFDFNSYMNQYKITNIDAGFFNGIMSGAVNFVNKEGDIDYNLGLDIKSPQFSGTGLVLSSKSLSLKSSGKFSGSELVSASGSSDIKGLVIGQDSGRVFNTSFNITADNETISIDNGFISNEKGEKFGFEGKVINFNGDDSLFRLKAPEIPLTFLIELFSDYLPDNTFLLEVEGSVMIDFEADSLNGNYDKWNGIFKINDSTVSAFVSDTEVLIENVEGSITIKDRSDIDNKLSELLGKRLAINREIYRDYLNIFREKAEIPTRDFIKIGRIKYGFFEADNIECNFEMDKEKINLLFLKSDVYGGHVYINGLINFGKDSDRYNVNMLFSDLSLENISNSLPSMKGYITGLVDGLLWFSVGNGYTTINGPFAFWAKDSKDEKRTIGRALLEKIGAKGRFFTGSSRRYDHGEISGYIKDGLITFKNFVISNKILGYTDLKIEADKKMNSISVKHLLSVIRELARRASKGDIEIEYQ